LRRDSYICADIAVFVLNLSDTIFLRTAPHRLGTAYCMQKQYIIAGDVTGGKQRGEMPPWQSKCENRTATLTDISGLVFVWFSVVCCFCVFIRIFSGDL